MPRSPIAALWRLVAGRTLRRPKFRLGRISSAGRSVTRRGSGGGSAQHRPIARTARKLLTRRAAERVTKKKQRRPRRFKIAANGSMCTEQRIDYLAACDGKITWGRYFAKWGPTL
jgi:hypothetical protein